MARTHRRGGRAPRGRGADHAGLRARRAGRSELRGVGFALLAALSGAGYVSADAVGVRLSGNVFAYAFLVSLGNAVAIGLLSAAEGRNLLQLLPRHGKRALFISVVSTASFLLYLHVVASNPVALAAALRETSVLFAVAIARYALASRSDPFTGRPPRWRFWASPPSASPEGTLPGVPRMNLGLAPRVV